MHTFSLKSSYDVLGPFVCSLNRCTSSGVGILKKLSNVSRQPENSCNGCYFFCNEPKNFTINF